MQEVPAFRIKAVASEHIEAGDTPDIGIDLELGLEDLSRRQGLSQYRAAPKKLNLGVFARIFNLVHPLHDAFARALWHRGMRVILVHDGEVIEHLIAILIHAL